MGYMKIDNLYKNNQILNFKQAYALEKVHGTSAHIQWTNNHLTFFSGGEKHDNFVALFDQQKLVDYFAPKYTDKDDKVYIYGEAYGGKQQGMNKTYGPKLHFIVFDVNINGTWLDVPKAEEYALSLGLEFVPYELVSTDIDALNHERDRDSIVAMRRDMGEGHIREGVVLRPPFEVRLNGGGRCMMKHKRDEFREHKTPRSVLDMSAEDLLVLHKAEQVADEWCVPMRLEHVLGKLMVNGAEPEMKDIPRVIEAMVEDIYVEAKGEIVESREVRKAIGTRAVKLFKQRLARSIAEV
jgi:hypothetical protein